MTNGSMPLRLSGAIRTRGLVKVIAALAVIANTTTPGWSRPRTSLPSDRSTLGRAQDPSAVRAKCASLGRDLAELEKRGDLPAILGRIQSEWNHGIRNGQLARYAATIAGRKGDLKASAAWLFRVLETRPMVSETMLGYLDPDLGDPLDYQTLMDDKDLAGVRASPGFARFLARARIVADRRRRELRLDEGLERATPDQAGLDPTALGALVEGAKASHSSGLVVMKDGKLVGEWYFGGWSRPVETMSASKAITSLGMGLLVDAGAVKSIDDPVWHYFPEWHQGRKEQITVRMLLNHTSGLQALRNTSDIYRAPDFVRLALAAEVAEAPGSAFFYNNKAIALVPAFAERTLGMTMQAVMGERMFKPLGIREFLFESDEAGHMTGFAGLRLHPLDFAKIGQMVLNGGTWQGRRIVSQSWLDESTGKAGQPYANRSALLWWIAYPKIVRTVQPGSVEALQKAGWTPDRIARMSISDGRQLTWKELGVLVQTNHSDYTEVANILRSAGKSMVDSGLGEPFGFFASGSYGNYLFVSPKSRLVVARMASSINYPEIEFEDFFDLVRELGAKAH